MSSSISNTRIALPPIDLGECEGSILNGELTLLARRRFRRADHAPSPKDLAG
jgi:hypothetical protein